MASEILASATEKVKDTMSGQSSKKTTDLQKSTKDVHDKNWRITSDYGVKQANTDEWLTVTSEDKTGPMLLEDNFGREKVKSLHFLTILARSRVLTTIDPPFRPRTHPRTRRTCSRQRCTWKIHTFRICCGRYIRRRSY